MEERDTSFEELGVVLIDENQLYYTPSPKRTKATANVANCFVYTPSPLQQMLVCRPRCSKVHACSSEFQEKEAVVSDRRGTSRTDDAGSAG